MNLPEPKYSIEQVKGRGEEGGKGGIRVPPAGVMDRYGIVGGTGWHWNHLIVVLAGCIAREGGTRAGTGSGTGLGLRLSTDMVL
eukprot:1422390-Ditylum_brightwellii.AAC.1